MKILHTSDWHIGRRLKEHDRTQEFKKFFAWLIDVIVSENIDTLLVAGDIFDNTTPTVQAQDIYYSFLSQLVNTPCRHIVIISGNHDSPAFLDAPSDLLRHCRIHVIGQAREDPADEVLPLCDAQGQTELIVCAVPYLRDRDVRTHTASDKPSDIVPALLDGIRSHYARVFERARELQGDSDVPVIAMGHLFMQGGTRQRDDGVRELYVGTAINVDVSIFPEWLTYTALGHLHSPQRVGRANLRYSGSPLAMGFGEAGQNKAVYIIELDGKELVDVKTRDIPAYQRLERASGDIQEIESRIHELGRDNVSIWLDVTYTGSEPVGNLQARVNDAAKEYELLEVLSIRDESKANPIIHGEDFKGKTLDECGPMTIFEELLKAKKVDDARSKIYIPMYKEILHEAEAGEYR